ncbi:anthranilate phosphoribosyltransferase [Rudaeicoccus suwonensis]|uniref:Anthranilate phosphoribosyltransferase n=1 Tax=Rudaeicoccus suwonensis TaxID=657409 RepID=A0A561EBP2_9MICO|nr:anthranilate phosphoribosyltransferase [Rudaeicoccus suwonensis]TWE13019.1 anthranilate phosphoribosyltransferase [Rudaeicoccus suwonensis]
MVDHNSWPRLLNALLDGRDLAASDTSWAMDQIMSGAATGSQIAGFLVALRAKGETVAELRGLADEMIRHAVPISVPGVTLDIVGTGGDGAHTVNISTMSAIVAAGAGASIVKHGNRAASSQSGAADVLEALGVRLDLSAADVARVAAEAGITFCFAQTFHPSFRHTAPTRSELGIRTAFNVLGPLTNPASPRYACIGAADPRMVPLIAGVFADRGRDAVVVRGDDGLDEATITTTSTLCWVRGGEVSDHVVDPGAHGLQLADIAALRGGDAAHNAAVVRTLLSGERGPVRDAVVLNAGLALAVVGLEDGPGRFGSHGSLDEALSSGMAQARASIDSGAAARAIERWVRATQDGSVV